MQTQTISNLYRQDKIASKLQSKYRKILLTFFDKDFNTISFTQPQTGNNSENKKHSLKVYSSNCETNLMKMIEEIKKAK